MAISIIRQSIRKPFYIGPCVPSIDHEAKSSHHNFVKCNNCPATDSGKKGQLLGADPSLVKRCPLCEENQTWLGSFVLKQHKIT